MYRILDKRGTGKTSRLLLLAKEQGAWVACSSPRAMESKAHAYGIVGVNFISYWDFYEGNYPEGTKILVDELEVYVSAISKGSLVGYALSTDD